MEIPETKYARNGDVMVADPDVAQRFESGSSSSDVRLRIAARELLRVLDLETRGRAHCELPRRTESRAL